VQYCRVLRDPYIYSSFIVVYVMYDMILTEAVSQ